MLTLQEIVDRARAGGEYQEVARRLGVNKATVSRWVQGIGAPAPEHVVELARLSGLSVAAVAVAALAARDRRQAKAKAWEQAWTQLARAGLATVLLTVAAGAPSPAETPPAQPPGLHIMSNRRRRRLEAASTLQRLTARTLSSAWHWLAGYSRSTRAGSAAPSGPTLGWRPA